MRNIWPSELHLNACSELNPDWIRFVVRHHFHFPVHCFTFLINKSIKFCKYWIQFKMVFTFSWKAICPFRFWNSKPDCSCYADEIDIQPSILPFTTDFPFQGNGDEKKKKYCLSVGLIFILACKQMVAWYMSSLLKRTATKHLLNKFHILLKQQIISCAYRSSAFDTISFTVTTLHTAH